MQIERHTLINITADREEMLDLLRTIRDDNTVVSNSLSQTLELPSVNTFIIRLMEYLFDSDNNSNNVTQLMGRGDK